MPLTATFAPSLGIPLAAFCTETLGWRWTFWLVIPPAAVAAVMVWRGLPQDPLKLERFRVFDWRGLLLGAPALAMLVIGLLQGERLDWLNSPLIRVLLGGGGALMALFLLNEWFHRCRSSRSSCCATATSATRCSRWAACWWCCWA